MILTDTAYAKLNLALHVRARRPDGKHALETIFAFTEDGDALSVEPAAELSLSVTGPFAAGLGGEDDLVVRAARALAAAAGVPATGRIRLDKRLPVAAGLGGGSADAAAALRLLSRLWWVDVPLHPIAKALGADVPACVDSVTVRGEGLGDELRAIDAGGVGGLPVLLVNDGVAMPTGPVFAGWDRVDRGPLGEDDPLAAALAGRNDLEAPAAALSPAIRDRVAWLAGREGVTLARMSGSGATCFALFADRGARDRAADAYRREQPGGWCLATALR